MVGRLFCAPFDVVLSEFDVVEPDLLYVSTARAIDVLTLQHVRGAPDLVIEISSPGTHGRDETIKRALYERASVLEYWIVDPEIDVVRIYAVREKVADAGWRLRDRPHACTPPRLDDTCSGRTTLHAIITENAVGGLSRNTCFSLSRSASTGPQAISSRGLRASSTPALNGLVRA
jgi:hypothetical protein